jgi:hypothetical protein
MDKEAKEAIDFFSSSSELLKVLGIYIENRGNIELNNPEVKHGFAWLKDNPEKMTGIVEKIHEENEDVGKELMLLLVDIGIANSKLANLEILRAEEKISLGKFLKTISNRMERIESKVKKLKTKKKKVNKNAKKK